MAIDTKTLAQLREMTGAGLSDCQAALTESNGDLEKAVEILRKKGAAKAAKKMAEREAGEGLIGSYIHSNGKIGVMVDVRCETDFVARNPEFQDLVKDLAMHIAAANPQYLTSEEVSQEDMDKEKSVYTEQLKTEGKPEEMIAKIVEGKMGKYFQEVCLLEQSYIKDDSITISDLITQKIQKLGEKIEVIRFTRYSI